MLSVCTRLPSPLLLSSLSIAVYTVLLLYHVLGRWKGKDPLDLEVRTKEKGSCFDSLVTVFDKPPS